MLTLDVCTTAIPRCLVERCLGSFLDRMQDRGEYQLRWLCHLDQYPGLHGLRDETLQQIEAMRKRFDGGTLLTAETQRGFGAAVKLLLQRFAQRHRKSSGGGAPIVRRGDPVRHVWI